MARILGEWPIERVAAAVHDARHHVRDLVKGVIGYGETVANVELMASELLTNAVEHGGGDKAHVCVTVDRGVVRVEVRDSGAGPVKDVAAPALLDESGRGLYYLVTAFASQWGILHDADGTTAWFEVKVF